MSKKIVHIANYDSFIPPFIEFVRKNFDFSQHQFYITNSMAEQESNSYSNVRFCQLGKWNRVKEYFLLSISMHKSEKVILHSLFNWHIVIMLFCMPWLLRKCFWVMWGGDLYVYKFGDRLFKWKVHEFFRRTVIKKMGHLVTYIKGDYELAKLWYGAKGKYSECFMYPSNLYKEYNIPERRDCEINILVGNSADPTNNHLEIFDQLEPFKSENIRVYAPLSYGNLDYARSVIENGRGRFGDKFEPLTQHMPFDQYLEFLGKIDIAIFNHERQQAMGNTITLLGLGKKVYMRSDVTPWQLFKSQNIHVYDIRNFCLTGNDYSKLHENKVRIKQYFSEENFRKQLSEIFS